MATVVGITGETWTINGQPAGVPDQPATGLLMNFRAANAIFDDENATTIPNWEYPDTNEWDPQRNTDEFCAQLPTYAAHGIRLVTVGLQGGYPGTITGGDNQDCISSAFNANGTLKSAWLDRLHQVLVAADPVGIVVIVNLFYFGQDHRLTDEDAVLAATDNATDFLVNGGYTNVLVEVVNESDNLSAGSWYQHEIMRPARVSELITRVQTRSSGALKVSYSLTGGATPTNTLVGIVDYVTLHGNGQNAAGITSMISTVRGLSNFIATPKPIIFNEDSATIANLSAAVAGGASWGYHHADFQSLPVTWTINTANKLAFAFEVERRVYPLGLVQQQPQIPPTTAVTSITRNFSSTPTVGNLMIAVHFTRADNSKGPAGWTELAVIFNAASSDEMAIYGRIVQSGDGTGYTFQHRNAADTADQSDGGSLDLFEFRGPVPSGFLDRIATTGITNSVTSLSSGTTATTTFPYTLAIAAMAIRGTVSSPSWDQGFWPRTHFTGGISGQEAVLLVAIKQITSLQAVETTASWTTARNAMAAIVTVQADVDLPSGFQPAWAVRTSHVLGGGVI